MKVDGIKLVVHFLWLCQKLNLLDIFSLFYVKKLKNNFGLPCDIMCLCGNGNFVPTISSCFSYHCLSGVSRAQISAPPGFSVPSRAPPPGFSSNERVDQAFDPMAG